MRLGKLFKLDLWVLLTAAIATMAADASYSVDVYPFTFGSQDTTAQLKLWNRLMKYKLFATGISDGSGITFIGQNIHITDIHGYVGSATGNFRMGGNSNHSIGGPVLFGGSFINDTGTDSILTGPTRFLKYFEPTFNSKGSNYFAGLYCFDAGYNSEYTAPGMANGMGTILPNAACSDTSAVYAVDTDLDVPSLKDTSVTWQAALSGSKNTMTIQVPPNAEGDSSSFSYFIESISFSNNAKLHVVMPPDGRLTKIFVKNTISGLGSTDNNDIVVVYAEPGSWDGSRWTAYKDTMTNAEYAGNLLFYIDGDLDLGAGQKQMQGTYIANGEIHFAQHTTFAGQLLAKTIRIDADFDAKDFKYVPFNPPVLDPTALAQGKFIENDSAALVQISLSKVTETGVSFKFCYDLSVDTITAADFNAVDGKMPPFCQYDASGKLTDAVYDSVVIAKNTTLPASGYEVYLNVRNDNLEEGNEKMRMQIFDLAGAVLPGNKREGYFVLTIVDASVVKFVDPKSSYDIDENSPNATEVVRIELKGDKIVNKLVLTAIDNTDATVAFDSLFSYDIVMQGGKSYAVITVKDSASLDYEKVNPVYNVTFILQDKDGEVGCNADTATFDVVINDVNETPVVKKQEFEISEHEPAQTSVGTVKWDDLDTARTFRNDVFTPVGGDTTLFSIDQNGVIKTKVVLDYETMDTTYMLVIKLNDKNDPSLFDIDTVVIHLKNINENPVIITETVKVKENSESGTVVDTIKATDKDIGDTDLVFTLLEDPSGCFEVSENGIVTVKECKDLDYEKNRDISIKVKVEDSHGGSSTKTVRVNVLDVPSPSLEITEASNSDSTWEKPRNPIYTNISDMNVCWEVNGMDKDCADTALNPGKNVIRKEVCDIEGFEGCAVDSLVVFYSDAAPLVTVSANPDDLKAANIYTIVERTDSADANIYVNRTQNDILVTVKDSASGRDTSFTVKLDLDTLSVPKKNFETLAAVAKESVSLDENAKNATRTPVNGTEVKVSYTEKVAGTEVTVSYMTDNNGDVIKQKVVNDKGKEELIEVITVSYETVITGKTVTVSYQADALTGARLVRDASGKLMTESAVSEKSAVGSFRVTYDYVDASGNAVVVTYSVDEKGSLVKNAEGNIGYEVSYTYVNKYGNSATQSVFIVLDQTGPKVEIISPVKGTVVRSNFVKVVWTVDGLEQDSLILQGLEKGKNTIKRIYRDKAGNESVDSVVVIMKDSKDVDISIEQPVTEISKEKVEQFYADNPPKPGQTFAVSIRNPGTGEEVETLVGGDFKTTEGSGKEPYPGETTHLGPTLALDVKLPVVSGVGGLATLDDLLSSDGLVPMEGIDADGGVKMTVEEYVQEYCEVGMNTNDLSRVNLYRSKLNIKIWVYTSLGNFVNYFSFGQDMNDPDYTNEAGMLQMFFELKPDRDGYVRAENGKMMGTGAYLYKVEASIRSQLRCTLPSEEYNSRTKTFGANAKRKGDVVRSTEDLLKPFGYKRPSSK